MDNHERIRNELQGIIEELFSISVIEYNDYMEKPLYSILGKPNALNWLYFLFEISKHFQVPLLGSISEDFIFWTLDDLTYAIVQYQSMPSN